jgi:regulator of cell morphogenesis and NO signaling
MQKYHTYTVEALSLLMQYSEKVAKVHGKTHPEVIKIYEQVSLLQHELIEHMSKEEKILFPYIRKLVDIRNSNTPFIRPSF